MKDAVGGADAAAMIASVDHDESAEHLIGSNARGERHAALDRLPLSCVRTFAVVARLLSISRQPTSSTSHRPL